MTQFLSVALGAIPGKSLEFVSFSSELVLSDLTPFLLKLHSIINVFLLELSKMDFFPLEIETFLINSEKATKVDPQTENS